jgi:hypothetical protein
METRLSEVQKRLWWLCAGSLLLALLIRPQPENRRYVDALAELESFRESFVRKQAEAVLQKQAEGRGEFSFARVQEVASAKRGPKLKLDGALSAPRALSFVRLKTLADAHAYAEPGASLPVGIADAEALGKALSWRMARASENGTFTLRSFELVAAEVSEEDVAHDQGVAELLRESNLAKHALDDAERKLELAEYRVEKRQKRRSSSLAQFVEARDAALGAHAGKSQAQAAALARYESAAKEALRPYKRSAQTSVPKTALARVMLEERKGTGRAAASASTVTYEIPVPLTQRRVSVPTLRGAEFSALRAAGLWDELSGLGAEQAERAIQDHFNWHLRSVELLGLSLSGKKVLQLLPCALVWLLALLALHMRRAETFYSPFTTKVPSSLPQVGLKLRWLELLALVILPLVSIASACVSLWQINQLPILPALSGVACLVLGYHAFVKLKDLREQAISIVRSHSYPPPAHDLSLSP